MTKTFRNLKLSQRLFLIIIILFLIPYLLLFSSAYSRAENIIRNKIRTIETENMKQSCNTVNNLCTNIINASDYLLSLDNYSSLNTLSSSKNYEYLMAYKTLDTLIQNINNTLLNSNGEISIFSSNELLYSTIPNAALDYESFYKEQTNNISHFSNVHESYNAFMKKGKFISYINTIPSLNNGTDPFYLVISYPCKAFEITLNTASGTMQLFDNNQNQICSTSYSIPQGEFQETMSISISGWKLVDTFSSDAIYKDIYDLRVFTFMVSAFLFVICLVATFIAISIQLKPLMKLKRQMQLVSLGNLDAHLPATASNDEISSLSKTFNGMIGEISSLLDEIKITQKRESELRFEMLLAQINPHFLFNTLNSIKWMSVVAHTDNITNTITSLGRLLEISMNKVNDYLPLDEELTNIKSYIQIQRLRYPGRFEVNYSFDEKILSIYTLKLILQPIVENSIIHNIEHTDYLIIEITGELSNDNIIIHVKDNGIGIPDAKLKQILHKAENYSKGKLFSGIGIYNVQERIQLAYGCDYGLKYSSDGHSYTDVEITFPVTKQPRTF